MPWLAVDPEARLSVGSGSRPVSALLAELDPAERDGVQATALTLGFGN